MEMGAPWRPNSDHQHQPVVLITPACPRCGSSNTKFCYYNNYSLTQPRYFCKGCRRYWTKGGSLRNVPIGGGCRKTRRGKSNIRVSTNHHLVKGTEHNGSQFSAPSSTTSTSNTANNSSIDLAAVYANFVTDYNKLPSSHQSVLPHDQQYFQNLQTSPHNSPGFLRHQVPNTFVDGIGSGGPFQSPLPFGEENASLYLCGIDKPCDQMIITNDGNLNFTSNNSGAIMSSTTNNINLPGHEDFDVSRGLLWPSNDVIMPNNVDSEGRSSELLNGSNVNPFSDLDAMFRF